MASTTHDQLAIYNVCIGDQFEDSATGLTSPMTWLKRTRAALP